MTKKKPKSVSSAFDIAVRETNADIAFITGISEKAFERHDYDKAKEALERLGSLASFRDRILALRQEWDAMASTPVSYEEDQSTRDTVAKEVAATKEQKTPPNDKIELDGTIAWLPSDRMERCVLAAYRISTARQLLDFDIDTCKKVPGIGAKSIAALRAMQNILKRSFSDRGAY